MPHGLTPLGRQLSHVLRSFHHTIGLSSSPKRITPSKTNRANYEKHGYSRYSTDPGDNKSFGYYSVKSPNPSSLEPRISPAEQGPISNRSRYRRRTWKHPVTVALSLTGNVPALPKSGSRVDRDVSHQNVRKRREVYRKNVERHAGDWLPDPDSRQDVSLSTVVSRYIKHSAMNAEELEGEYASPFVLRPDEDELLRTTRSSLQHIRTWAAIVQEENPVKAATMLVDASAVDGETAMSGAILRYLLRRRYIGATALRVLLDYAWQSNTFSSVNTASASNESMTTFVRMLRHAKEAWPEAINSSTALLLQSLPQHGMHHGRSLDRQQVALLTHAVNKVLSLLSFSAAESPFKNNIHQEKALLRVLRYMADFQPQLALNREGYRAVIRLQLAQGKTSSETQWAELKALSWPPWKEERTAMDAAITLEHGTTRAGHTLERMAEAGYAPRTWEKVAKVYTGWDPDRTPTIQTRSLFVRPGAAFQGKTAETMLWAARIDTTRTIQEAWACYLAYEDLRLTPSEDVLLAILHKLHEEERRHWRGHADHSKINHKTQSRIYPGDAREITPPPPSTHLETYTRTAPPSVDHFYRGLSERGVEFNDRCLAFLVANASKLKDAVRYIRSGLSRHPAIEDLLRSTRDQAYRLQSLPDNLFHAFLSALCKHIHAHAPLRTSRYTDPSDLNDSRLHLRANPDHPLVHATHLLCSRPIFHSPSYHTVLRALAQYQPTRASDHSPPLALTNNNLEIPSEQTQDVHHLVAFRLAHQVICSARRLHGEVDAQMLLRYCTVVEKTAQASWRILHHERSRLQNPIAHRPEKRSIFHDDQTGIELESDDPLASLAAKIFTRSRRSLWPHFKALVGDPALTSSIVSHAPRATVELLTTPPPALLHALIRALGWSADFAHLLRLVRWMAGLEPRLKAQREGKEGRNGEMLLRRALVGVRVFGERSFLPGREAESRMLSETDCDKDTFGGDGSGGDGDVGGDSDDLAALVQRSQVQMALVERLESPAPAEVVQELAKVIGSVEGWGGWPGVGEVEEYLDRGRDRGFGVEVYGSGD